MVICTASAWWGTGHLLVARIAYDTLEKESPETVKDVEALLGILKKSDPKWTQNERDFPLVECATFGDDIKSKGGSYQADWHFVDTPFVDDSGNYQIIPDKYNVTEAIDDILAWFNHGKKDSVVYESIMKNGLPNHSE
jgi:hypothetical protein